MVDTRKGQPQTFFERALGLIKIAGKNPKKMPYVAEKRAPVDHPGAAAGKRPKTASAPDEGINLLRFGDGFGDIPPGALRVGDKAPQLELYELNGCAAAFPPAEQRVHVTFAVGPTLTL